MGLLDELSDKDLRDLAALVGPYLKESAIQVENVPSAETLDGIRSLPGVQFLNGVKRTVAVPVSSLKGRDGDKGQSLDFIILGSYNTLDDLKAAHPNGADTHGLFKVGDALYIWAGAKYEPLNLDVFKTFSLEQFADVGFTGNDIIVDFTRTPYAKVTLSGDAGIFNLSITGTKDGSTGKILVFQTGFKQISLAGDIKGTIDLPLNGDTVALLSYHRIGDTIYMHSNTVLGDVQYPTPSRVPDFQVVYYDSSVCTVQWTAPHGNNIYDKVTGYDIRYANGLVDADDPKVWEGLKNVEDVPAPGSPGTLQRMTLSSLSPNKEYYIYLKSVKVNYGVRYVSAASDFAYCRTTGAEDLSKAYRINLTAKNIFAQDNTAVTDSDGGLCTIDRAVDESGLNQYLEDGYPDTSNKSFPTYWLANKYSRASVPYDIFIDLFSVHSLDRLFVFSISKPKYSVFAMKDFGYEWEYVGAMEHGFNTWQSLPFSGLKCRFVKLSFDLMDFGFSGLSEGLPKEEWNGTIEAINNILVYGRPVTARPGGIMPPIRRAAGRHTVDQFFCTNGHAYQQGRLHSMCSGERVRLYIHPGHFATNYNTADAYTRLADMKFRMDNIPWITGNGSVDGFIDLLGTYKKNGLRPYLTFTGTFDYCKYPPVNGENRPCDGYWLEDVWTPLPSRGVGGLTEYFKATMSPGSYRTYAKLCMALGAKFGNRDLGQEDYFTDADGSTGLDLLCGIEPENEPDKNWSGWRAYSHAEEYAAVQSASSDGNSGTLSDEDGSPLTGGRHGGLLSVCSGLAGAKGGYMLSALLHWKQTRPAADIPMDVFNVHMYCSNIGEQGNSSLPVQYGIPFEQAIQGVEGRNVLDIIELRDRYAPDKEVAVTETGWGEAGARESKSKYQCYSQPGCYVGDWLVPDRHRSDVKGAWIVRECVQMMGIGIDFINYFSTECDMEYFNVNRAGAGFEMFHWNDCADTTPGAKTEAVKAYEATAPRSAFDTTGLFGNILDNGAYPITRAYWWVATMRTRLKGYVFTGFKSVGQDARIVVACFKKKDGDGKGAYVVYLNDSRNTGVAGVEIPLPEGVSSYTRVTTYVPEIPNPQDVPSSLGTDKLRTGLPAARKERYVGGAWRVVNPVINTINDIPSYSGAPADYPDAPVEGDEVTVIPTPAENPYFPIVGPVCAKPSSRGNTLGASSYETDRELWQTEPQVDGDGNVVWFVRGSNRLVWRQVDAVCDYIEFTDEGRHGCNGDETLMQAVRGMIRTNVSEFPEYYFFDAVPDPDFNSAVTDLSSVAVNESSIELWWNNTNPEDTGYEIFVSSLPETGYSPLKTVTAGVDNRALVSGLKEDTVYYFKIRPVNGDKQGTLSDYTSVRTRTLIPAPCGLSVSGRTAASITLEWTYPPADIPDFVYYAVFRAGLSGGFEQSGTVADRSVTAYTDSGLPVGATYLYKVRAVGLNGQSDYSNTVEARTLTAEESSPLVVSATTDKLGTKIVLSFDLPLSDVPEDIKGEFTLTEGGNPRLITGVTRNEVDHRQLFVSVPQDSLSDYDRYMELRIGFSGSGLSSEYGVAVEGFDGYRVANVIGNFINLEASYRINFTAPEKPLPEGVEWNNCTWNAELEDGGLKLADTYERPSSVLLSSLRDNPNKVSFGGNTRTDGVYYYPDIPQEAYKTGWDLRVGYTARLKLSGLNNERKYTVRSYASRKASGEMLTTMSCGDMMSNGSSNTTPAESNTYMLLEDLAPSHGELVLDFSVNDKLYSMLNFMLIDEYKSNEEPENREIYLRGVTVVEAVDGVVKANPVTLHLNMVGTATSCRVSESEDMSGAEWMPLEDNAADVPYTVTSGFGDKTLYVQLKNLYYESNIRSVGFSYRDGYVPVALRSIYINNDAPSTHDRNVRVFAVFDGIPTHYKVSEDDSLPGDWLPWPDASSAEVPYILSSGYGNKTVYMRIKDDLGESYTKADIISYEELVAVSLAGISIENGAEETAGTTVRVRFDYGGSPTHYRMAETEPELAVSDWMPWTDSITYTFNGIGSKTLYAQIKDSSVTTPSVSDGIEVVSGSRHIRFADSAVEAVCVANWSSDGTGLSYDDAAAVTDIGTVFKGSDIRSFDEFRYFTGVTVLQNDAFRNCTGLSSIMLPPSLATIMNYVFSNCRELASIVIPDTVTVIGNYSFDGCRGLVSCNIPDGITTVGECLFRGCGALSSISIPASVTLIGKNAFYGCAGLRAMTVRGRVAPELRGATVFGEGTGSFVGWNTHGAASNKLYVPTGASGYDTGLWADPLQHEEKCGFMISYSL